MWFEIIPSFAIITVALSIPGFAMYHIHNGALGNVSEK
jgi:NADH dehydrogenase (ubiquinone) 1 alpha subcomplex subunit 1